MRLGRLVAAGLVAGAVAGFVGALLRPRTVQTYRPDADRPATDPLLATARSHAVPESRTLDPVSGSGDPGRSEDYALATSAPDDALDGLTDDLAGDATAVADGDAPAPHGPARTFDVDALAAGGHPAPAPVAAAPSRGANG